MLDPHQLVFSLRLLYHLLRPKRKAWTIAWTAMSRRFSRFKGKFLMFLGMCKLCLVIWTMCLVSWTIYRSNFPRWWLSGSKKKGRMLLLQGVRFVGNKMEFVGMMKCIWNLWELRYLGLNMVILKDGLLRSNSILTFTMLRKSRSCKSLCCTLMGKFCRGTNGNKRTHRLNLGMGFWKHSGQVWAFRIGGLSR